MLRPVLLTAVLVCVACSGDSPPDTGELELVTNASSYEWIPGVPPPPLTLTLHNRAAGDVSIVVCSQGGQPTAPIRYQLQQVDDSWADISFGSVTCDTPGAPVPVASGATWIVPPELQAFPPEAGTYRIVLTWVSPADTSVEQPIFSDSFTVVGDFEPPS